MSTPFEELEYLVDYLPEEGEAVIVTRRSGELICETFQRDNLLAGIADPEFYGRLVQANERLGAQGSLPVWSSALVFFWGCVAVHQMTGMGWRAWYLDVGLGLTVLLACCAWIRQRQTKLFHTEIRPMLNWQVRRQRADRYSIIGAMRQHPELRRLLDETSRWMD